MAGRCGQGTLGQRRAEANRHGRAAVGPLAVPPPGRTGACGAAGMIRLNLGCGQNKKEGYVNLDKYDSFSPDVVWDLERFPWPFETSSVGEVALIHCLEHLGASADIFLGIMKELYR